MRRRRGATKKQARPVSIGSSCYFSCVMAEDDENRQLSAILLPIGSPSIRPPKASDFEFMRTVRSARGCEARPRIFTSRWRNVTCPGPASGAFSSAIPAVVTGSLSLASTFAPRP
jgi:hypothetical protein